MDERHKSDTQLALHGPCAVGCEEQVLLGRLGHRGCCEDERGQGDCDRGLELAQGSFLSGEHAVSSPRHRAVGRSAFDSVRGATWERRRRLERILTDVSGGGACRGQERRSWRSSSGASTCCQQFQGVTDRVARAETVRLGPGSPSGSSASSGRCSAASTLMIARGMGSSVRPASKEAAHAQTPRDRDLHPMCTLREQTPRKQNPKCARKYLKNKEIIWSRRADSNR